MSALDEVKIRVSGSGTSDREPWMIRDLYVHVRDRHDREINGGRRYRGNAFFALPYGGNPWDDSCLF